MAEERPRKGGKSFPWGQDGRTKTARPTSVGPHHARDHQEDPANPGIRPEDGYGAEIARNNAAAAEQPTGPGARPVRAPARKPGSEMTEEEAKGASGPARDAPPLRGTSGD